MINAVRRLAARLYRRRIDRELDRLPQPEHIALVMDGNRRWAREHGLADPSDGHRRGAEHVEQVLRWCERRRINHLTVFVASTENLVRRPTTELQTIMATIERVLGTRARSHGNRWQIHLSGRLDVLPDSTRIALKEAAEATADLPDPRHLSVAIGYGGRQEILDAVRDYLDEAASAGRSLQQLARTFEAEDIGRRLYHPQLPEADLIIRTSGEVRLSNFLLWQGVRAEYYFCDAYWPGFTERHFLRALRTYGNRVLRRDDWAYSP